MLGTEDGDSNVGKTIRIITQDKKCARICEIKLTLVPSCSQMRLQLLHFNAIYKTWPTFQELMFIVSFRRRRWSQRNFSEKRNIQAITKVKICLVKYEDYEEIFF